MMTQPTKDAKPEKEARPKNVRNMRFYRSVAIAIVIVFAAVLMLAVVTTYLSNRSAYANSLRTRATYQIERITQSVDEYSTEIVHLCNNTDIIQLLSRQISAKEPQRLLEKEIADDLWNSVGQKDVFVGVALEDNDRQFYLQNTNLADFSDVVRQTVKIETLKFAQYPYDITQCEYKNDAVVIISSPVMDENGDICGYLHVIVNHLVYHLPKESIGQEDYLFAADTGKAIACNGFVSTDVCTQRIQQAESLQKAAQTISENEDITISYVNADGANMFGAMQRTGEFVLLTAVTADDMARSIVPITLVQVTISCLLISLLFVLISLLFNRTTKPVTEMIEQCSRLAIGEEVADIGTSQDSDLNQLGAAFNVYRKKLENAVYSDSLLGIGTRYKYIHDVDALIAAGNINSFGVFVIDIKEFGKYNDVFSIELGDSILCEVSARLSTLFRKLYRINGDVFLGILAQTENQNEIAEEIHHRLKNTITIDSYHFEIQCRVSICSYPAHGQSATALLEKAQSALHHTKEKALADTIIYNDEMVETLRRENEILTLLQRRIADRTLEIWYQPIFHLQSKTYRSAEALLRLKDDTGAYLSPFEVISIAEKNNMAHLVGNYVLENTCRLLKKMETCKTHSLSYIQVNLSVQELARTDFVGEALTIIHQEGISPSHIGMEVTETMVIQSFSGAIETLNKLRNHGIRIAMDDFGSGYSGINYLSHLPFDILKLDRELVLQVDKSEAQRVFVKTIVELAKIKNMQTVAEGVETQETLMHIISCNVDSIQGYCFSKPLREADFITFIEAKHAEKTS